MLQREFTHPLRLHHQLTDSKYFQAEANLFPASNSVKMERVVGAGLAATLLPTAAPSCRPVNHRKPGGPGGQRFVVPALRAGREILPLRDDSRVPAAHV